MANQTLWGTVAGVSPASASFHIFKLLTNGTASPEVVFNAANPVPRNFTMFGFEVWNNINAAQAAATATLWSNLSGGGLIAVSDPIAFALPNVRGFATTIAPAQATVNAAAVIPDVVNIAKQANTNAGWAFILAMCV